MTVSVCWLSITFFVKSLFADDPLLINFIFFFFFFFQGEDGIRDAQESRGLGDVYKRKGKRHTKAKNKAMEEYLPSQKKKKKKGEKNLNYKKKD